MSTISTMRTGHRRLADGSLLRVGIESGPRGESLHTDMGSRHDRRSECRFMVGECVMHDEFAS